MAHREGIREFLKDVQVHGRVIDWGCGTKPIKNYLKENDAVFTGLDILDHVEANIVCDIEQPIDFSIKYDFAFCLEVIEHIWDSKQLIKNVYNNLVPGGKFYLSQPFFYEVHKEDDRVRYTYHGLEQLLEEAGFKNIIIQSTGGEDMDHAWGYVLEATK